LASDPQKILVIRLSSIGDILLTTPLLRNLRKRFPDAGIDFVVKKQYIDLIDNNKNIDRIYSLDTSQGFRALKELRKQIVSNSYDLIIDIHKNFRSYYLRSFSGAEVVTFPKFRIKRFLLVKFGINLYKEIIPVYQRYMLAVAKFGISDDGQGLDFFPTEKAKSEIRTALKQAGLKPEKLTVCLAAGASFETKRWPAEYYRKIAKRFVTEKDAQIILCGDENDRAITRPIADELAGHGFDFAGRFTLMQTACVLEHCDLVITNDTGLVHLATALKKKTVAIFGPTTKELGFFPTGKFVRVVEHPDMPCRPCTHIGSKKCPKGHFRCMKELPPDQVWEAAMELLSTTNNSWRT